MKKQFNLKHLVFVFSVILLTSLSTNIFAQVPGSGIFFQAVARDSYSNPAKDRKIVVETSLLQSTANGVVVLRESFETTTDVSGVFSVSIGEGTRLAGTATNLQGIDWSRGPYFLNIKVAIAPIIPQATWDYTKDLVDLGTSPFGAVPYAMYAGTVAGFDTKLNVKDSITKYVTPAQLNAKTFDQTPILNSIATKLNIADSTTKYVTPAQLNAKTFDSTAIYNQLALKATTSSLNAGLALKENQANKTIDVTLDGTSDIKYPSAKAVKTYVDASIVANTTPLTFVSPLSKSGFSVSIPQANGSNNGYLNASDWTSFNNKIDATQKAANNGVATLGNDGKIPSSQIPAISFQNVSVVNSIAAMIAISGAQVGSIAIRTDNNNNYVLSALPASTASNWIALATPVYVSTVNGFAGPNVVLTTNEVSEGANNKYYTDARARGALSAAAPLVFNNGTGAFSIPQSSNTADGFLSATDWNTFNNKQNTLVAGTDYVTPSGNARNVTGVVAVANGGTGTSTTTGALVNLGAEAIANKSNDVAADATSVVKYPSVKAIKDYVDLQSANAGVADNSLTSAKINGTIAIGKGGTGATTATDARTNLGLVIGTNVMAANATTTLTGDVVGSGNGSFSTTVNSVGGVSSSTIATFNSRITSNTASITANETAIAAEATTARAAEQALTTSVNANTASITANTTSIISNTNAIAANTTSINANTASITSNATAIAAEATTARAAEQALTTSVNANTASITANTTSITSNTNAITANTASITANATAIAAEATTARAAEQALTTSVNAHTASITANTTSITSNTNAISANTASISANTTSITSNTNAIAANTSSINANTASITANTTSITSNTNAITANTASINANTASITANATAIAAETTTARAAEQALTTSLNANTASITANTTSITSNTNAIAANTTSINANTASITANTTSITSNTNAITANTASINANTASITTNTADILLKAPIASPTFTGTPFAPTPATSDNSTKIATTEYVKANLATVSAGTLTGTTLASTITGSSLTSVGTITSGVWGGTAIAIANGGTGATTASAALTNLGAEAVANKSTDITADAASTTKYPSVKTIKDYVDTRVSSAAVSDGSLTNAKLVNSNTILGSTILTLGGTVTSVTGLTSLEATNLTGTLSGTSTTATNLAGGVSGSIPYQTAAGTTAMIPVGSANQFLTSTGSGTYTWTSTSAVTGNFVPYTGASGAVNLGAYDLTVNGLTVGKGGGSVASNTAVGYSALAATLSSTFNNTAVGYSALSGSTGGNYNTVMGQNVLKLNTTSSYNTAIGAGSLAAYTALDATGGRNVTLGAFTGQNMTAGWRNVILGYNAGVTYGPSATNLTSMDESILIGYNTKPLANATSNEIVIGTQTIGNGYNTVTIGNSSITANYFKGSINLTGNINGGTWSGTVIGNNFGGAGTTNGLLKANGSGVVSAAVAGTDFQAPLTAGSGISIVSGTISATGLTTSNLSAAAGITNVQLANSTTILGSTIMTLGGTVTSVTGLSSLAATNLSGALSGNATTATTLATSRNINGVAFNGSADITVTADAATLTGTNLKSTITGSSLTSVGTITSGTWSATEVAIAKGGTGATTAADARTNLGLGSLATKSTIANADIASGAAIDFAKLNITKANIISLGVQDGLTAGSGISIASGTISATGLTTSNLASNAAITNAQLANSATILGSTTMTLGGTVTSVTGLASVTSTGFTGTLTGNASTATKLAATKNINGVAFDGSADITIAAASNTLTGTILASNVVSSSLTSVGTITTGVWSATTIDVAHGGTGVTSSTGSGSLVLSTSPTLVTPILGTPTSVTLTNATGLPIATGVSGLGTGIATFLATPSSANLLSAMSDETGSGSIVFANTPTLVTPIIGAATGTSLSLTGNLSSAAGTFSSTLSAGATTLASLSVTGNQTVTGTLGVTGATSLTSLTASGTSTLTTLNVTGNETVTGTLGVTGVTTLSSLVTPSITGGSSTTQAITYKPTSGVGATGADHIFQVGTNGGTEAMRITNAANIGVGTNSPTAKFDVAAGTTTNSLGINLTGSIDDFLEFNIKNNSATSKAQSGFNAMANNGNDVSNFAWMGINNSIFSNPQTYNIGIANDVSFLGAGNDMYVANASNKGSVIFSTGTATTPFFAERMRITNSGTVAIGTTGATSVDTTNAKLHVAGKVKIVDGAQAAGKVLTSDANGVATWQNSGGSVVTMSATGTATSTATYIIFTGSTASQTITIPSASTLGAGRELNVKNVASVSVAIASAGGYLIMDNTTLTNTGVNLGIEPSNNWIKLVSDGTNWYIFRALF